MDKPTRAPPPSPVIMARSIDMSDLLQALPPLRPATEIHYPEFRCGRCDLHYKPDWFHFPQSRCFFCMRFQSPSITRYALLYETQWYFIQSGQDDARTFYGTYFELLHRWADRYHIPITSKDIQYQTYLIQFLDEYDPPSS
jgi:hypothetical protein